MLVVDDERNLRELACCALERAGFTAIPAAIGIEALALWRERRGSIGLVLADVAMPNLAGPALVAELRALEPGLPIVLMSALGDAHPGFEQAASVAAAVIEKPFRVAELLDVVRTVLRPAPGD